jgi:hypothetical protein
MRKLLAGATFLLFGAGAASNAHAVILNLKGSDTLEDVVKAVIADPTCSSTFSAGNGFAYVGGGSGAGQNAMVGAAPTQDIAPMSRELNGTACTATANELLIGLDGIAIVGAKQVAGDSLEATAVTTDDCNDSVQGDKSVAVADCSVVGTACDGGVTSGPGTYTFTSWKDVLAVVYAGQNHVPNATAPLLVSNLRNPARINCAGPVRQTLVNNWGTIFSNTAVSAISCRSPTCVRLKHAFRRDDLSGTTDTFVGLIGLIAIPPSTNASAANFPIKGTAAGFVATANPFCNAGEGTMNKGDSDYLDLDPIRRIADSEGVLPDNRAGREQVAQGYGPPANPPAVLGNDTRVEPAVTLLADFGASNRQNVGPDPSNAGWTAAQQTELPKRRGLGLVLPIAFPGNFNTPDIGYWAPSAAGGAPTLCTPGVFAPTLPDTAPPGICPDGTTGLCNLPVNSANPALPNFNCMSLGAKPSALPIQDERVYNLLVLTPGGKYVYDNYTNTNLALPATRQRRVVSGFFRLHTTRTTNFAGTPTGGPCALLTSATDIIGCLVKSNPCSIGFAGRESVDNVASMAFRLGNTVAANDAFPPSTARINNLVLTTTKADDYGLARTLWVNTATPANLNVASPDEGAFLNCFGQSGTTALVDSKIAQFNFVTVPAGVTRARTGCPQFP